MWAEARHRYQCNEKWHLTDETSVEAARLEQEARLQFDSWTEVIAKYLEDNPDTEAITTTKILDDILGIDYKDHDIARRTRVGIIMRQKLKWQGRRDGARRWFQHPDAKDTDYPAD